jgi:flagellar motor switch protein FliM
MSKEALSQSEIDALLSQSQINVETASEEQPVRDIREKTIFSYNFRKQKRFNKGQFVFLEGIHKRFLRNFEVTLTNLLSTPVIATLAAATELSFGDCVESFASPTCLYVLNVNDGSGKFIVEIDPNFAFFVIDKILGGSGKGSITMNRELSLIEENLMNRVVRLMNKDLEEAWEKVDTLSVETEGFYSQPDYVQAISLTDTVILISMDVRNSDRVLGYLNLCIPSNILETLLQKYDRTADRLHNALERNDDDRRKIEHQVHKSMLPVKAILGETTMNIEDVLSLRPNDVIFLHHSSDEPIDVVVGDLRLFKGYTVAKENVMTIQISKINRL